MDLQIQWPDDKNPFVVTIYIPPRIAYFCGDVLMVLSAAVFLAVLYGIMYLQHKKDQNHAGRIADCDCDGGGNRCPSATERRIATAESGDDIWTPM